MKISPMRLKMNLLRQALQARELDQVEQMLNNSKGTGTTNLLVEIAQAKKAPILVDNEKTVETLQQFHPDVTFHPFSKQLPGQRVLIDVSAYWVALREAQKIRKLAEDLLNWMEYKNSQW